MKHFISLALSSLLLTHSWTGLADTADTFASPESAVTAYLKIPTTKWRQRIPLIADPDSEPLMKTIYDSSTPSQSVWEVSRLSGATDPKAYATVGSSGDCYIDGLFEGNQGRFRLTETRTHKGFQVNWRRSFSRELFHESLWIEGEFAKDESRPEITIKELKFTPEKYRGKPVKLLSLQFLKLLELSNYKDNVGEPLPAFWWGDNGQIKTLEEHLKPILGQKIRDGARDREQLLADARQRHFSSRPWQRVGFRDRYGTLCDVVFFQKPDFIAEFMEMKETQLVNVKGTVLPLDGWAKGRDALFIQELEILKDTASDLVKE